LDGGGAAMMENNNCGKEFITREGEFIWLPKLSFYGCGLSAALSEQNKSKNSKEERRSAERCFASSIWVSLDGSKARKIVR
jgi:hypothetical protein